MSTQRWRIKVELEWDASETMVPDEDAVRYRFEQLFHQNVRIASFAAEVIPPAGSRDTSAILPALENYYTGGGAT